MRAMHEEKEEVFDLVLNFKLCLKVQIYESFKSFIVLFIAVGSKEGRHMPY